MLIAIGNVTVKVKPIDRTNDFYSMNFFFYHLSKNKEKPFLFPVQRETAFHVLVFVVDVVASQW